MYRTVNSTDCGFHSKGSHICSYQLSVTVLLFPYCTENVVQSRGVSGMKNTELVVISLIEATSTYVRVH